MKNDIIIIILHYILPKKLKIIKKDKFFKIITLLKIYEKLK